MMRGLRSTLVLLAILLGLAGYIYFVESERPPASDADAREKVFGIESDALQEIRIDGSAGEPVALRKQDDTWRLVEPLEANADPVEATGLVSGLANLEIQRVVEESPGDLAKYGLEDPRIEVAFRTEEGGEPRRLLIGDETATGGDLYARTDASPRVFLISAYLESTFDKEPFDLRNKAVLEFARDEVASLALSTGETDIRATKSDNAWTLQEPWQAPADFSTVEGLVTRLQTGQMQSIAAQSAEDLAAYGLDTPRITATVGTGSAQATLQIGSEAPEGGFYARDLARSEIFVVEQSLVDDLSKGPAEFRRQDVFEARAFNITRVELTQAGQTSAYERASATAEEPERQWRRVAPTEGEIENQKVQDLLTELTSLRAESFADSRRDTGLDAPGLEVTLRYDEGKQERVAFGRSGDRVFATTAVESSPARIPTDAYERMIKALDALGS